ncbi:lipoprotein-anchoring transpeptidase ErfK/SrfK [Paenibacillus endophyticus]|uniref:Lipoprotein-anchoring transpeptidase ErfK/SrfK n=1 Tax=Paenibacillus endophyticus TaxID=1294268 RepID=A0A7W5C5Q9_9BACL|nr:L,D-transpeptidase [Paenibacillus endophyticus]MBB3151184.1 lipoprotein-anchoring transpeptidase ErfK/SrfK [Paenibacillus endophyticus]
MDSPEDIFYLKQFVKQHPDNQMGWYLLGKQYLASGKEGKANYCFLQAGEVYDAFEHESHPLSESQLLLVKEWGQRQRKKRRLRKTGTLTALLLLLAVLAPANGAQFIPNPSEPVVAVDGSRQPVGVVFIPRKERNPIGSAWNSLVAAGKEAPQLTYAARLEEDTGWRHWKGNTRLLMAVEKEEINGKLDVDMLDSLTCSCEPTDASAAEAEYSEWQERQETHWTLASAVFHYERKYKKWPQRLDDLIQPYPNNVISGEREGMRAMFPEILKKLKAAKSSGGSGNLPASTETGSEPAQTEKPNAQSIVGSNGILDKQWSAPLSIVVDKSTHRLAVVQGDIIVRSYKVGLGGEETPEGSFYISEKVRNPNGRDDGDFGSRGMTLSGTLYAIHGTDEPDSIGKDESLGCVRMGKEDVEELFDMVPLGTIVQIKNGTLPNKLQQPKERFELVPSQNETNPAKVYKWLT